MVIEFAPPGMLVTRVFENTVHVFALYPLLKILKEPLHVKHAMLLGKSPGPPAGILEHEAQLFADTLNRKEPPFTVGKYTVKTEVCRLRKQVSLYGHRY